MKKHSTAAASETTETPGTDFKRKRGFRLMGLNLTADGMVKGFFGGNAYLAILFLLFICLFLFKSASGFIPGYRTELAEARTSGIEAANHINYELTGYEHLYTKLNQAFISERRTRFSTLETVVPIYEEFEAIIDEQLEDQVDAFTELDEGESKQTAAQALKKQVTTACAALSRKTLLKAVQQRLSETIEINPSSYQQALEAAQQYALNDFETPEEIETIPATINSKMGEFGQIINSIKNAASPLRCIFNNIDSQALATYKTLSNNRKSQASIEDLTARFQELRNIGASAEQIANLTDRIDTLKTSIIRIDPENKISNIYPLIEKHDAAADSMIQNLETSFQKLAEIQPTLQSPTTKLLIADSQQRFEEFKEIVTERKQLLSHWRHDKPVTIWNSLSAFFFGTDWKTGSERQSLYGIIPLFSGTLLISIVAMVISVPLAIGAAIYVNQFATLRESNLLKPAIEFIQAIPSVVLGLFGVLVVAGLLQSMSDCAWLTWIPGFPIENRLNVFLAGLLLAFMAAPTIFTLAEDALNNVPKAFTEASLAMGATRLQTTLKVIVPSSASGIIAAVMLGFGRVIGETMVVLLVAGNSAKIPDFGKGIGVIAEPVHTMTGIIAQEYGEVEPGALHWEALFMIGLVLFLISLSINTICQRVLARGK